MRARGKGAKTSQREQRLVFAAVALPRNRRASGQESAGDAGSCSVRSGGSQQTHRWENCKLKACAAMMSPPPKPTAAISSGPVTHERWRRPKRQVIPPKNRIKDEILRCLFGTPALASQPRGRQRIDKRQARFSRTSRLAKRTRRRTRAPAQPRSAQSKWPRPRYLFDRRSGYQLSTLPSALPRPAI
jgi:hypothetical protein